jgi:hypothetical protein
VSADGPQIVYRGPIAGMSYYDFRLRPDLLEKHPTVNLVAEPENKYDAHAIRVETLNGKKIGYIPRTRTDELHRAWGRGATLEAKTRVSKEDLWVRRGECASLTKVTLTVTAFPKLPPAKPEFGKTARRILFT